MSARPAPAVLDGSQGEGGGQIVRTALFLSTLAQEPVTVVRIRRGRPQPGLKPQHVGILQVLQEMTGARVEGGQQGSEELRFTPGPPRPGSYAYDIGTAGSIPLFLQTLLPVALLAPGRVRLRLRGGTDVAWSPTVDWLEHAYLPLLTPLARRISFDVQRRGFYPAGGGVVRVEIDSAVDEFPAGPEALRAALGSRWRLDLDQRGNVVEAAGVSVAEESLSKRDVAARQRKPARAPFHLHGLPTPAIRELAVEADSPGSSVTLWVTTDTGARIAADALGARGKRAEEVGAEAATKLLRQWDAGATVDAHLADHLVPWIALFGGRFRVAEATAHLRTNAWVCQRLLPGSKVEIAPDGLVQARPGPA